MVALKATARHNNNRMTYETTGGSAEIETPILCKVIELDDERAEYCFSFEGNGYDIAGPRQDQTEFITWLADYAAKTPRCACCQEIIFPGQPVTLGTVTSGDSGHSHFSSRCNDTAAGYAGSFDTDGELIPPKVFNAVV